MLAAVLLCAAGAWASAARADTPTIAVTGDSVIVTGQTFGQTTVQATRPDAITHKPVVIGQFQGLASSFGPFSVNTTVPTPLQPNGDCWQAGALASPVTPDLQAGDTVTVTQTPLFGQPTSTSVPVTAATVKGAVGPIPGCSDIAPLARNGVSHWPASVTGGPIALLGVSQPFAKHVSVSATDGKVSTTAVTVSPAQSGAWSATIAAAQVDRLANGPLTLAPVFEVPDVSTGATAHIAAGAALKVTKSSIVSTPPATTPLGVRVPARLGIGFARRNGFRVSFVVPAGARVVRVQLRRQGKTLVQSYVAAGPAGSRQTVRLRGTRVRRALRRGRFQLAVSTGANIAGLGAAVTGTVVVH